MELKLKQSLLIELKYLISGSVVPYAIIFSIPDIMPSPAQVEKLYCIVFSTIPIQYFSLWADWSGSLKFPPASFKKAGRLEPAKRKTKNRNTETIATTNSEIDDHLSQRPLSRTGWMASWQIGATLRGLGRTLPTPPTLFVRHRRDKDDADADDDDDDLHIIMSVC